MSEILNSQLFNMAFPYKRKDSSVVVVVVLNEAYLTSDFCIISASVAIIYHFVMLSSKSYLSKTDSQFEAETRIREKSYAR